MTQEYELLPPPETRVWRYVDVAKLLDLLATRSLFLCRADLFDDAFEGAFTEGSINAHAEEWGTKYALDLVRFAQWIPSRSYIQCWHTSEYESAALWKIYGNGIALQTTVGALQFAFPSISTRNDDLLISQDVRKVQYIDYQTEHPHLNDSAGPLCYKRKAFKYEQEIRIIRQELPTCPSPSADRPDGRAIQTGAPPIGKGISIPVDLSELIDAIHVAPSSPPWLLSAIERTIDAYGFAGIRCRQSTLDQLPEYGTIRA